MLSAVFRLTWCCAIALLLSVGSVRAQTADPRGRLSAQASQALVEKRYDDAARAFEQLRDLSPDVGEIHASLGFVYFQQGRFKESVSALERALALKRDLPNLALLLVTIDKKESHFLRHQRTRIGRNRDNDIVVSNDRVSRYHAEILREGDNLSIVDLGSRNGVRLNGWRISTPAELKPGDIIRIGGQEFTFVSREE